MSLRWRWSGSRMRPMAATAQPRAYINGTVFTADPERSWVHAFGVRDGRVVCVGKDAQVIDAMGAGTEVVDLNATLVTPGFVDGHFHTLMTGESMRRVDLLPAKNLGELQDLVNGHGAAHPEAEWVLGRSWLFDAVPGGRPTAAMLDTVVPDRPVMLDANDYHSTWVNSAGLRELGIDDSTPDPAGGRIDRDSTGQATGFLEETASDIAWTHLAEVTDDRQRLDFLQSAVKELNAAGVTGVIDMGLGAPEIAALAEAERSGWLNLRVIGHRMMSREGGTPDHLEQVADATRLAQQHASDRFRVTGIKFIVDGVIDGCTAHVSQPYTNGALPEPIWDYEALAPVVAAADAAGLQCALHAIGDAAVRSALDAFQNAALVNGTSGRRHRIEHIEYLDAADVPRFAELGVTASMQPVHSDPAIQDNWREMLGAERAARGFPVRELVEAGARVVLGTDAPTAPFAPLPNMYIAATRRSALDSSLPPNGPWNALPIDDAFCYATANAAWSVFAEDRLGRIAPGQWADFILVEPDVLASEPESLLTAEVLLTVVGGREVHRAG